MNPTAKLSSIFVAIYALIVTALGQVAGPPGLIDYQGQLLNSLGGPITGAGGPGTTGTSKNYEIRFRIWDAQTGGNLFWAERQIVTVTAEGFFSVRLGEGEEITAAQNDPHPLVGSIPNGPGALLSAFNGNERFLGVTVMNPPATPGEIQPRLSFLATPFAVVAETARYAEFGPSGGVFSADSIGVNEDTPETSLHIDGKTYIEGGIGLPQNGSFGGDGSRLVLWKGSSSEPPYALGISSNTLWYGGPSGSSHRWFSGSNETMTLNPSGSLRISGHLRLGDSGIIDDDSTFAGEADDWIRLNGYIEMKSSTDSYGIVLRDHNTTSYLGMTQVDGASYFADTTSSGNYFLKGDGSSIHVPGHITGGEVYADGWFRNKAQGRGLYNEATGLHWYSEEDGKMSLYDNSAGSIGIRMKTAGNATRGFLYADAAPSIGLLSPTHTWIIRGSQGNGTRYASYDGDSNWDFYSDRRLKKDIQAEENLLERLVQLDVVNYHFKDETKDEKEIGFIAQDVEKYFPSIVSEAEDERYDFKVKALGYTSFGILAVGGLKELKLEKDQEIKNLQAENAKLRSLLEAQEKRLSELAANEKDRETRLSLLEARLSSPNATATPIVSK